jgi:hypothetical protein
MSLDRCCLKFSGWELFPGVGRLHALIVKFSRIAGAAAPRAQRKARRNRPGLARHGIIKLSNSDSPDASGAPMALGPDGARSSRRNHRKRGRRRRSVGHPSPSRRDESHARRENRQMQRRRSALTRPLPAKLRPLQQARVCVTSSSPRSSDATASLVMCSRCRPPKSRRRAR